MTGSTIHGSAEGSTAIVLEVDRAEASASSGDVITRATSSPGKIELLMRWLPTLDDFRWRSVCDPRPLSAIIMELGVSVPMRLVVST